MSRALCTADREFQTLMTTSVGFLGHGDDELQVDEGDESAGLNASDGEHQERQRRQDSPGLSVQHDR